jgi:hypothetical protein
MAKNGSSHYNTNLPMHVRADRTSWPSCVKAKAFFAYYKKNNRKIRHIKSNKKQCCGFGSVIRYLLDTNKIIFNLEKFVTTKERCDIPNPQHWKKVYLFHSLQYYSLIIIRIVVDPRCLSRIRLFSIPDPNCLHAGSRIPDAHQWI